MGNGCRPSERPWRGTGSGREWSRSPPARGSPRMASESCPQRRRPSGGPRDLRMDHKAADSGSRIAAAAPCRGGACRQGAALATRRPANQDRRFSLCGTAGTTPAVRTRYAPLLQQRLSLLRPPLALAAARGAARVATESRGPPRSSAAALAWGGGAPTTSQPHGRARPAELLPTRQAPRWQQRRPWPNEPQGRKARQSAAVACHPHFRRWRGATPRPPGRGASAMPGAPQQPTLHRASRGGRSHAAAESTPAPSQRNHGPSNPGAAPAHELARGQRGGTSLHQLPPRVAAPPPKR
mmetsp:Transcript_48605/g.106193  ORF Transcript_48605/g.106193 Transcript_48605/m.106193 type:complete len:296 (+) Transcript_48605:294-1181(+)